MEYNVGKGEQIIRGLRIGHRSRISHLHQVYPYQDLAEGAVIIIEETKERRHTEALRIPFLFCGMYMRTKKGGKKKRKSEPANKSTFCHDSIIAIPGNMRMCR